MDGVNMFKSTLLFVNLLSEFCLQSSLCQSKETSEDITTVKDAAVKGSLRQ
jgi:hypothetical protein